MQVHEMVQNVVADKAHSHRKNINFRVIRGFVFSNIADNEVSNLLGQFSITATVSAFIAGIIMTALSSVTLEELEYARDFCGYENDRGAYLVFVCVIGLASASSSLIASTGLYISLSSLNFGSSHALSDELLEIWFRRLEVFYFLSFSGLFVSIFCMVICLFYLGVIKYMNVCKNFTTGFVYAAIGVGFMVMIFLGSIYLVREHLILSTRIKTKLEDYFDGRELDEQEKKVVSTKLDTHIQWTSSIERIKSATTSIFIFLLLSAISLVTEATLIPTMVPSWLPAKALRSTWIMSHVAFQPGGRSEPQLADHAVQSAINRLASNHDHVAIALEQVAAHLTGSYVAPNAAGDSVERSRVRFANDSGESNKIGTHDNRKSVISSGKERINSLHNYAKVYADRAKLRENKEISKTNSRRKSFVNKTSEKIVKEKELLHGETTATRLSKATGNIKDETIADISSKLTFQPMLAKNTNTIFINSKFNQYSDSTDKFTNLHNRSQKWIENKNTKLQREKQCINREVEKELTFRPLTGKKLATAINASSSTLVVKQRLNDSSNAAIHHDIDDSESISARNISWMRRREERLNIERRRKEEEELKGCTFVPNTSRKTTQKKRTEKSPSLVVNNQGISPIPSPPTVDSVESVDTVFTSTVNTYDLLSEEEFLSEYESFLINLGQV